jgi:hypothetical protein
MGAETETRHVEDQDKKQAYSQPEKREIVIVRYDKSLNEAVTGNKRGYRAEILHVARMPISDPRQRHAQEIPLI